MALSKAARKLMMAEKKRILAAAKRAKSLRARVPAANRASSFAKVPITKAGKRALGRSVETKIATQVASKVLAKRLIGRAVPIVGGVLGSIEIAHNTPKIIRGVRGLRKDLKALKKSRAGLARVRSKKK